MQEMIPSARIGKVAEPKASQHNRRWKWAFRLAGIAVLLFFIVPCSFGTAARHLAGYEEDDWGTDITAVDTWDFSALRQADRMFALQGSAPGWGARARHSRIELLESVINGVSAFDEFSPPPAGALDSAIAYVMKRSVLFSAMKEGESLREDFEDVLDMWGRHREIIELASRLPPGGNIKSRLRAHLILGDLKGAAALWSEPETDTYSYSSLSKPAILCAAEDYTGAISAFRLRLQELESEYLYGNGLDILIALNRDFVWSYLECLLVAKEDEMVEKFLLKLASYDPAGSRAVAVERGVPLRVSDSTSRSIASYARLRLALQQDQPKVRDQWLDTYLATQYPELNMMDKIDSLVAVGLVRAGQLESLSVLLAKYRSSVGSISGSYLGSGYINESHLREVALALAQGSQEVSEASKASEMREVASDLYTFLGFRLGIRHDPEAAVVMKLAAKLHPASSLPGEVTQALAVFYGERSEEDGSGQYSWINRFHEEYDTDRYACDVKYHPGRAPWCSCQYTFTCDLQLASLLKSDLEKGQKLDILRAQLDGYNINDKYVYLAHLIVHGESLGADVSAWRAQLTALATLDKTLSANRYVHSNAIGL